MLQVEECAEFAQPVPKDLDVASELVIGARERPGGQNICNRGFVPRVVIEREADNAEVGAALAGSRLPQIRLVVLGRVSSGSADRRTSDEAGDTPATLEIRVSHKPARGRP